MANQRLAKEKDKEVLIESSTSIYDTTISTKKGAENIKEYIYYQFVEKFFMYLSGPIFIAVFAFFGYLINLCTAKIHKEREQKKIEKANLTKKNLIVAHPESAPHPTHPHGFVSCINCAGYNTQNLGDK